MTRFKSLFFLISCAFLQLRSQAPSCPSSQVYIHSGSSIYQQSLPGNGPSSLVLNNMPAGSGGLAVGPNLGFPAPNPTYWTTSNNMYWYWNGTGWTNTTHNVGNTAAVNIGVGGGFMYNLVGGTGQIYVYNGTGNGTLLTTIAGFNGGGPYDVVVDNAGNFFLLKNSNPQSLSMYSPSGALLCSWTLANNPTSTAGGGFAIIGNTVYYNTSSFYAGNIIPGSSVITFSPQGSISPSPSDFASCPIPVPTGSVLAPGGGTLNCTVTQLNLVAQINPAGIAFPSNAVPSSTLASCNYTWSGPGIIAGQGTGTITVNQPGVYSYTTCAGSGCPTYSISASYTVVGQGSTITPTLNAPTCMGSSAQISVLPNTSTNTISWTGPGIVSGQGTATIDINVPGTYSVSITNTANACAGTSSITVNQNPTVTIALSSNSICSQNFNNSPTTLNITAGGASSYTWISSPGFNYTPPGTAGPHIAPTSGTPAPGTYTIAVVGANGSCTASAIGSVIVVANPVITVSQPTICQNTTGTIIANGAASYNWTAAQDLSPGGATATANPQTTAVYSVFGSSNGCYSSTESSTVTVLPNPQVNIIPATPTICAGDQINLTASGGATSYNWSPSTGLSSTSGANVNASPQTTQTYTVIGTMNTCTSSALVTVSVIPQPNLIFTNTSNTICAGYATNITVTGASNYSWTPSTGLNTAVGGFVIASPAQTTVYNVTAYNGACIVTGSIAVYIVPQPDLVISAGTQFLCNGSSTQLTATGAQYYQWSPATGLSSTNGNVVTAAPATTTNYTIIASNSLGTVQCSAQQSYSLIVIPNAFANLPNSLSICRGQATGITVSGGNTYTWSPAAGLSSTVGAAVAASPSVTTIYTVNSSYNGNCASTGTVQVIVNPLPIVNAGRDTIYNLDDMKHLYATGTGTLTWVQGDEIWCTVCPQTQIFTSRTNCYTIMAENEFGCKAYDDVCVTIKTDFGVYIPNIITPNGDGMNDVFYIYGYSISDVKMDIFNRWGQLLFSSNDQTVGWPGTYKGQDCANGVYVYKISYKGLDGKIYNKTGHVSINK
jgi:gliding motility-associated-like protein